MVSVNRPGRYEQDTAQGRGLSKQVRENADTQLRSGERAWKHSLDELADTELAGSTLRLIRSLRPMHHC